MSALQIEDFVLPALVTLVLGRQSGWFAKNIRIMRKKDNIVPPSTSGPPAFNRAFRAQQNALEMMPVFLVAFWVTAAFSNTLIATVLGSVYVFGRWRYFLQYIDDPARRVGPFRVCMFSTLLLLLIAVLGVTQFLLLKYASYNLKECVFSVLPFKPPV
ncbi:microsomal glutathione S-transferase 2-like [Saccoglossus kowalevskii]|uniref:Microsomal glutathione S-transferase 2-like n=1 Tax=Saccoglossus kowalevskii TaxID=10224 RepID=A0ABM0GNS6_SACKO|nr:PREDICTED: microsomal glutathione S-transferase 2-like [Saccoglossus kowalevskii]